MAITECDRIPRALRRGPGPMHGGFAPILFVAVRGKPMIHRTAPTGRAWSAHVASADTSVGASLAA